MSKGEKSEGRMSRWSRRKLENAKEESQAKTDRAVETDEELAAREAEELQLLANREAAEAIDLDAADKDTDFSVFMKSGVPATLKRRALSVLWRSDPVLANLDELLEYGENFADPALNMEVFQSAWQIGKGYLDKAGENEDDAPQEGEISAEAGENSEKLTASEEAETSDEPDEIEDETTEDQYPVASTSETEENQPLEIEPESFPKVSLRKRLMLEENQG